MRFKPYSKVNGLNVSFDTQTNKFALMDDQGELSFLGFNTAYDAIKFGTDNKK